jgi:hypothetical protein
MPDPRQHVRPGQKLQIAAQQINFLNGLMRQGGGFGSGGLSGWTQGTNIVLARNDTGADLDRFGVLEMTGIVIDPESGDTAQRQFWEMPCLVGTSPDIAEIDGDRVSRPQKIGIALEPIPAGKIGRVIVSGPVVCKLDVRDQEHRFARAIDGDTQKLETAEESDSPAQILWKADGSDPWAVVVLDDAGQRFFFGKATSSGAPGGMPITVDRYDDGPLEAAAGGQLDASVILYPIKQDSWVIVWNAPDGKWYVVAAGLYDPSCQPPVIAGHDLTAIANYSPTKLQLLGHDYGCLKWIDTEACPAESP